MSLLDHPARLCCAAEFRARLLRFINEVLPGLHRQSRRWPLVSADTGLFENGLLDSLSILHLIAAVEELTRQRVPDDQVVMKHFQSVDAMTAAFCPHE